MNRHKATLRGMAQPACPGVSPGLPCVIQLCMLGSGRLLWLDDTNASDAQALQEVLATTKQS